MDELGVNPASMDIPVFTLEGDVMRSKSLNLHLTVALCASAAGEFCPSGFVVQGQHISDIPQCLLEEENCWSTVQVNGYMDSVVFEHQFTSNFIAHVNGLRVKLQQPYATALLVLDGHSSRLNANAMLRLACARVIVLCLPSHTTHVLQPLDSGVNKWFKERMRSHIQRHLILPQDFNMGDLCHYALEVLRSEASVVISRSFAHVGLSPLRPDVVLSRPEVARVAPSTAVLEVVAAIKPVLESLAVARRSKKQRDAENSAIRSLRVCTRDARVLTRSETIARIKMSQEFANVATLKRDELVEFMSKKFAMVGADFLDRGRRIPVVKLRGIVYDKIKAAELAFMDSIEERIMRETILPDLQM